MALAERGAAEAAQRIADALEAHGYRYAIGGALALAIAGVPRGTAAVDVNVFVGVEALPGLIGVLQKLWIDVESDAAIVRATRDGMFVGRWDGMRIDVFLRRVRISAPDGWSGWFLSAEAIAVFELLFFRGKDIVDLERLVAVRGSRLDRAYVRRWLVDMMGEDDQRVIRWDEIVARFGDG